MKIACIIQARTNSTRLPGKMLMDLGGKPVLWHTITRAKQIEIPVIVAIPEHDPPEIIEIANRCGAVVNLGPEHDVLARYYYAAKGYDAIMRICGDQPLIDPEACRAVLDAFQALYIDWCANDYWPSYPVGLGCEVFSFAALELAHQQAKKPTDREHISPWITRYMHFTGRNIRCPLNGLTTVRLTIDDAYDLDSVRRIDAAGPKDFSLKSTLEALERAQTAEILDNANREILSA